LQVFWGGLVFSGGFPCTAQVPRLARVADESRGAPPCLQHLLLRAASRQAISARNSMTGALGLLKQLQRIKLSPGPQEHVCAWSERGICHPLGLLSSPLDRFPAGFIYLRSQLSRPLPPKLF